MAAELIVSPVAKQDIDEAYDRMQKSDVKYRFVIDNASLAVVQEN